MYTSLIYFLLLVAIFFSLIYFPLKLLWLGLTLQTVQEFNLQNVQCPRIPVNNVRKQKEKYKIYEMKYEVVPYPDISSIIRVQVKNEVVKLNNSFKIMEMRELLLGNLVSVTDEKMC